MACVFGVLDFISAKFIFVYESIQSHTYLTSGNQTGTNL